jgi:hypothetical protein
MTPYPQFIDLSRLEGARLTRGRHERREDGTNLMELIAYLTGEPHTDMPECVPSEISTLGVWINDHGAWETTQQRTEALIPLIPKILGARRDEEATQKRLLLSAHHAAKKVLPEAKLPENRAHCRVLLLELIASRDSDAPEDVLDAVKAVQAAVREDDGSLEHLVDEVSFWAMHTGTRASDLHKDLELLKAFCEV